MHLSMLDSRRSDAGSVSRCLSLPLRLGPSRCVGPLALPLSVLLTLGVGIISALRVSVPPLASVCECCCCALAHVAPSSPPPLALR